MNAFVRTLLGGAVCLLPLVGCDKDEPGGQEPQVAADFKFETLELTQGSVKVRIAPEDKDMTYYFGIREKSDFVKYENHEDLQEEEVSYIKELAASQGVSLEEFLLEGLLKGVQEWKYNTLTPQTDYVFYAYGLSTEAEILTQVNSFEFKTPAVGQVDVKFDITATDVTPTSFTLNVTPDRDDCAYYYDVIDPATYFDYCGGDPAGVPAFVENWLSEVKKTDQFASYTWPEFIAEMTVSGRHSDDSFENLLPEATFYAFAVCVANDGTCISEATVQEIKTTESPKNVYTVSDQTVTDVSYSAVVTAEQSEAFAVMMELQEYFADAESDDEIIRAVYDAHNGDITAFMYADAANVSFDGLIPNDKYYLLIFACNPDGTPKLDGKTNLKKVEVNTAPAKMSAAQYEVDVYNVTKTGATVQVNGKGEYENETFLFNYITKADYEAIPGDKTEGLKGHMDAFIDARVKAWNDSHPDSGVMTRKEFLSRSLMHGKKDTFVPFDISGLTPGTEYYIYLFGLKADGTYTTAPVTEAFATVADLVSQASIQFDVMSYGYETEDLYMVWPFAQNASKWYFQSFVGTDEWAGKTVAEIRELLKDSQWPSSYQYQVRVPFGTTWYGYAVAYDNDDIPTKVYRLQYTSPAGTGDGFGLSGGSVYPNVEELSE